MPSFEHTRSITIAAPPATVHALVGKDFDKGLAKLKALAEG